MIPDLCSNMPNHSDMNHHVKQKSHFHVIKCKRPVASSDGSDSPSVATLSPHTSEVAQRAGGNPSCEEVSVKGKYPYS